MWCRSRRIHMHKPKRRAGLILILHLSLSLSLLFHNQRFLPVPIRGYHLQILLTLPCLSLHFLSPTPISFLLRPHLSLPSLPLLLYRPMPIICQYSCYIGPSTALYPAIGLQASGFAARDNAYDVMLSLGYITTPSCKSCSSVFCGRWQRRLSRFFARWHFFINIFVL